MLIIDTHAHIYSPDEAKYPPIEKPLRPPSGKGSLEHLRAESASCGVAKACLIQTGTFYRYDNRYTADSAKANPSWTAGVCTLGPENPESPSILRRLVRDFGMKGLRSIPAPNGSLDDDGVRALWRTAAELGIVVNVLINRNNTDALDKLLAEFPALRVVLDHCMYLKAGPGLQPILADVQRVSRHRNLHAKLTFIPTGSATGYPCADMHDACMAVVKAYGPERCVWGSDFPCELWTPKVSYTEHVRIFAYDLPLNHADREQVLGKTAQKLWFR